MHSCRGVAAACYTSACSFDGTFCLKPVVLRPSGSLRFWWTIDPEVHWQDAGPTGHMDQAPAEIADLDCTDATDTIPALNAVRPLTRFTVLSYIMPPRTAL